MADKRGARPVVHTKKHLARLERERRQTRLILFSFIGILVAAALLLAYGYLDINYFQLQKPVAKVGAVEITSQQFQTRAKIQREGLLSTYQQYSLYQQYGIDVSTQLQQIQSQLDDTQSLGQNVLNSMIDEELIRQESAKRGITVSDKELEDSIRGAEGYYPDGTPTPTLTPTEVTMPTSAADVLKYVTATSEFTATPEITATTDAAATSTPPATATATIAPTPTLSGSPTPEPTATPYTLEGFQKQYSDKLTHFSKYGLSEAQYRELFRTDLLRKKLYEEVTADVPHTEEQVWARHILVADEATALVLIDQLKKGADFGELAATASTDTASGAKGGDLGWFGKGAMVAPFEEAAFSLKVGEISQPVKSDFGYHIIQVIARENRPLDAAGYKSATDRVFSDYLAALRETYKVETFDLWKQVVPTVPSFDSMATEAAQTQQP
jgi:parvulin-like peptidyl-prolyl isomerase